MTEELPDAIKPLFEATGNYDPARFLAGFTDGAVVADEGHEYRGKAEIKEWRDEVNRKYRLTYEVLSKTEEKDETIVTARVAGNFEGSPVQLRYFITFSEGKIAALKILS